MESRLFNVVKSAIRRSGVYGRLYGWCMHDNWFLGKYVELRGDRLVVEGCSINLKSPRVSTRTKSRLLLNQYEGAERYMINRYVDPEMPVVELGAAIGVLSCIVNRRLTDPRQHVAVEADPGLLPLLVINRDLNGSQFAVINAALAYGEDTVPFFVWDDHTRSSLSRVSKKTVRVPATSLQRIMDAAGFNTCTLVCDIEGAEYDLFENEAALFQSRVGTLIIELHNPPKRNASVAKVLDLLANAGFVLLDTRSRVYALRNERLK
jgi:FkbM family methyltransferase